MNGLVLALLISVAGGVGAAVRHLADSALPAALRERFPWGIMIVNLTGSLTLGILTGLALQDPVMSVLSVGLLGGYTTFSTASFDSVRLFRVKRYWAALLNGPGMLAACVCLATLGIVLARG